MKTLSVWICVFTRFLAHVCYAQTVSLSYPVTNSVIQRNTLNTATVTVAGQLNYSNLAVTVSYRFRPVGPTGVAGAPGPATNLGLAPNGMFYALPVVNKGWYLCEILVNGVVYTANKFGVGDVFIIAGQSNAQGIPILSNQLPPSAGIPEWVVGTSEQKTCTRKLPESFTHMFPLNTSDDMKRLGALGPTGITVWAYAILGKLISDANGGMPVAFFNAATGGSSVTEWKQGADGVEAKHPYTGAQVCLGYMGGSMVPKDYYGQPYTALKTALNYYSSLFGVRAVLWHQGETDSDPNVNPIFKASSAADYQTKLQAVIAKSRSDFAAPNLTWYICKATISKFGPINATIRAGQGNTPSGSTILGGADTDYVNGSAGTTTISDGIDDYRVDSTHFYEGPGATKGLTWLANKWAATIGALTNPVPASYVPLLTYSKSNDWRTLTAPSGGVQYHWNSTHINNQGVAGGTSSVYTTDQSWFGMKCYMKDAIGNWHVSAATNIGQYVSQREGAESAEGTQTEQPGFALNAYPNPYTTSITIVFNVPDENSDVKLDITDIQGNVVKTVMNNPHAKGKWQYEVKELPDKTNEILFCRLKVNDSYTIKKLVHLNR
ncbi:Por secretion system C-terminal sorting domain-containing protein [Dyadobacter soli]|uniref:Por secretion system C-terminal sorting domain-containing protein n=1 Tax=Dyadobacter soli TaxID=659014 RepID=A0A1G6Y066_9BACT|nr:sialate O-acetylesterase [Dyadobacter soli]SDD83789.1 Por secretion system C-terminal sorting domain-containing protein [Dyadobacter soli]